MPRNVVKRYMKQPPSQGDCYEIVRSQIKDAVSRIQETRAEIETRKKQQRKELK